MRRALAPSSLLRFLLRPVTLVAIVVLAGLALVLTVVGPFGFAHGFNKVAGSNTYGPISPIEALGIWPSSNYRLDAPGGAQLTGLAGAVAALALLVGVAWWVRRRDLAVPIALGACTALYLFSLPFSGDYSRAKALMIAAPLAMLLALRPLLRRARRGGAIAAVRLGRARRRLRRRRRSTRASWRCATRRSGRRDTAASCAPSCRSVHGKPVLYAGQDRYAAYELLGADTHVPLVEFPDNEVSQNPEKPFDTGDAYSPIDFDSFSRGTLDRFRYVITGRAAWNSQAPANFRRIAATPSYVLWERTGPTPPDRHVLLEGTEAGATGRLRRAGDPHPHLATPGAPRCSRRRRSVRKPAGAAAACSAPARPRRRR